MLTCSTHSKFALVGGALRATLRHGKLIVSFTLTAAAACRQRAYRRRY
jgi:hypothetical protein